MSPFGPRAEKQFDIAQNLAPARLGHADHRMGFRMGQRHAGG